MAIMMQLTVFLILLASPLTKGVILTEEEYVPREGKSHTLICSSENKWHVLKLTSEKEGIFAHCDEVKCNIKQNYSRQYDVFYNVAKNEVILTILKVDRRDNGKKFVCTVGKKSSCKILHIAESEQRLYEKTENGALEGTSACSPVDRKVSIIWMKIDVVSNKEEEFQPKFLYKNDSNCSDECEGNNKKNSEAIAISKNGTGTKYFLKMVVLYGAERIESKKTFDAYFVDEQAAETKEDTVEISEDTMETKEDTDVEAFPVTPVLYVIFIVAMVSVVILRQRKQLRECYGRFFQRTEEQENLMSPVSGQSSATDPNVSISNADSFQNSDHKGSRPDSSHQVSTTPKPTTTSPDASQNNIEQDRKRRDQENEHLKEPTATAENSGCAISESRATLPEQEGTKLMTNGDYSDPEQTHEGKEDTPIIRSCMQVKKRCGPVTVGFSELNKSFSNCIAAQDSLGILISKFSKSVSSAPSRHFVSADDRFEGTSSKDEEEQFSDRLNDHSDLTSDSKGFKLDDPAYITHSSAEFGFGTIKASTLRIVNEIATTTTDGETGLDTTTSAVESYTSTTHSQQQVSYCQLEDKINEWLMTESDEPDESERLLKGIHRRHLDNGDEEEVKEDQKILEKLDYLKTQQIELENKVWLIEKSLEVQRSQNLADLEQRNKFQLAIDILDQLKRIAQAFGNIKNLNTPNSTQDILRTTNFLNGFLEKLQWNDRYKYIDGSMANVIHPGLYG